MIAVCASHRRGRDLFNTAGGTLSVPLVRGLRITIPPRKLIPQRRTSLVGPDSRRGLILILHLECIDVSVISVFNAKEKERGVEWCRIAGAILGLRVTLVSVAREPLLAKRISMQRQGPNADANQRPPRRDNKEALEEVSRLEAFLEGEVPYIPNYWRSPPASPVAYGHGDL
jgi:hypothetical protein